MEKESKNQLVTTALKGIISIIDNAGIINIDLSEITHFINEHNSLSVSFGESYGENRINEAIQMAFATIPDVMFQDVIVYFFSDKEDITVGELGSAIDSIQSRKGVNNLIWGIGRKELLDNKLQVIIIAGE